MRGSTSYSYYTPGKDDVPTTMCQTQVNDEALQFHWKTFPAPAKEFILGTLDNLSLKRLVDFWSNHPEYTSGSVAGGIYGASWYLALVYLNRNELSKARSLTLNGSFLQECYVSNCNADCIITMMYGYNPDMLVAQQSLQYSSFDRIASVCTCGTIGAEQLPYFVSGFNATHSTQAMYSFLQRSLPREYQQMLASFVNMGTKRRVMNFVGSVNQDWESKSLKSSLRSSSRSSPEDDDITLVIGGDSFRVCPTLPLKAVFNEYAEKNSVSLKSLRFSYAGKTLFLSTAGKKSPKELGMFDNDAIEVLSTQVAAPSCVNKQGTQKFNKDGHKKQKKASKKTRSKSKKGSSNIQVIKSDEEHKEEHSKMLTRLFEEADPKFKQLRQQLNALSLLKQQPKTKFPTKKLKQVCISPVFDPTLDCLGGKAGKTRFVVNVGEVANLYKSSKTLDSDTSASTISTVDLHGCTQEEAILRLNSGLKEWNEQAMLGTYPFIHSVTIICGAGGQVLSETVEKWIRRQPNVSNAPKTWIAKQRFGAAA